MNKNAMTRFDKAPTINHVRTRFDLSHTHCTTFNTGDLVPILIEPVFPGDTFDLKTSSLTRLETSLHQTMDNAYIEFAYFFVKTEDIWDNFEYFMGASDDPWAQQTDFHIPQLYLDHGLNSGSPASVSPGSLLNHLGLPVGSYGPSGSPIINHFEFSIDALPLRAIFKTFNDWYRDENYDSKIYFDTGDSKNDRYAITLGSTFLFNGVQFNPATSALKVNRLRDVFSTALPAPQKGQDTTISLGSLAPVITGTPHPSNIGNSALQFVDVVTGTPVAADDSLATTTSGHLYGNTAGSPIVGNGDMTTDNQWADLSAATAVTINELRLAIVRQAMKERDARGGTRLTEKIASIFDISVNPLEMGRSEFLGGKRIPVNMMEVLQTSETGTTVLGTDAGHSKTVDFSDSFIKSFNHYGYLLGFMYVRTNRSYSQGIDRKLMMKDYLDFLDPMLDNIGEIPVYKKELYALTSGSQTAVDSINAVWAYQEQYYWLKERTNRFSGYFQPGITGTLDSWHYGDNYNAVPFASSGWLKETPDQVDRTIAVSSSVSYQWSAEVNFDLKVTRALRKYSIPNTFGF